MIRHHGNAKDNDRPDDNDPSDGVPSDGGPSDAGRDDDAWLKRRTRDVRWAGVLAGPGYLYRPREVLVSAQDEQQVEPLLRDAGGEPDEANSELERLGLEVRRWYVDPAVDVPELVARSRMPREQDEPVPRIAVNTVFAGEPRYQGGPGGSPRSTKALDEPTNKDVTERAGLAVLDTGWARDVASLHASLMALLRADADDVDLLDVDGEDGLDTEAGHGTFICGLVRRLAPGMRIDVQRVLDPVGWGDDWGVALGLAQQDAAVLNLSFGGYTADDRPPLALEQALRRLGRERVVVAAAGNNGSERPFWPAAFKHVVAVAALDTTGDVPRAVDFSNRGPWVDVCAPGVHLQSTYVRGRQDAGAGPQQFEGWACWSGTSFAAPVVAAAIAREVAAGAPPRAAAAGLLGGLSTLPGLEDFGVWFDPGVDLLCREH